MVYQAAKFAGGNVRITLKKDSSPYVPKQESIEKVEDRNEILKVTKEDGHNFFLVNKDSSFSS